MTETELSKIFSRIPTLETERMIMRRAAVSDGADMYDYSCREDVTRYLLWEPHLSQGYTERYLTRLQGEYRHGRFFDWALEEKAPPVTVTAPDRPGGRQRGRMIGTCGFTGFDLDNNCAEIGYVINPRRWGRGLAAEAVACVIAFGFCELGLNRIEARYIEGNERSRRVMEKCGMAFEGISRSSMYVKGEYRSIGTCAILYGDYINRTHCKPAYITREDSGLFRLNKK